ncbi:52 kDa repressor of the inhibitor of the protein kinase-like [Schistocerca piceifrons]|uniref:52 kDa repressor of the inhibitor of the protein kinase-like n=1 Tax=Schistocerca piceifrons TaxID=274613 RepID=UPI001F5F2894|nr:52 kDa repressor of the inhibitor of the protein kinase-like [Schistocerca piceifrons]
MTVTFIVCHSSITSISFDTDHYVTGMQYPVTATVELSPAKYIDFDIGRYVCHPPANDEEKLRALKEPWTPRDTFKLPVTGKKNLSYQRHWTTRHSRLVYSDIMQGAFCKICVLLGKMQGGCGHQELGAFLKNRRRLKAIVETILLCGRQEIALRGCRDSGVVGINEPAHNDGNFRALLRFRARSGDEALKNHLLTQNIHSRAMYTSSGIQNEVSELCGNAIQPQVLKRVKKAGFFTELTDETRDISRQEQLALCLRYVDCPSGKSSIMEDFLDFIYVEDVSAQALGNTIITHLLSYNLDMDKLVGQGFDGAAIMSGQIRGVRTMIAEQYLTAQFVHCVAHVLNLVLAHSCEIPMIRNCIGTIKSIVNFFRQSPLRDNLLKKISDQTESSHSTLISLCETRWTEKHVAVERFAEMLPVVCAILEALQDAVSRDVATEAYQLQTAMENSQFIMSLVILRKIFSYTANLNKAMQKVSVDLMNTCSYAKTVKSTLQNIRNESEFLVVFEQAKQMSSSDITVPRTTGRQTQRSNVPGETAEIYYRRNVFYPFPEHVITELDARFKPHEATIEEIQMLLPEKTNNDSRTKENLKKIVQTFLEVIDQCDELFFPSIKKFIIILATLPVSTPTPERCFSTMKRLKTYIRNKMGAERLTGLALMSVHRDLAPAVQNILVDALSRIPQGLREYVELKEQTSDFRLVLMHDNSLRPYYLKMVQEHASDTHLPKIMFDKL